MKLQGCSVSQKRETRVETNFTQEEHKTKMVKASKETQVQYRLEKYLVTDTFH